MALLLGLSQSFASPVRLVHAQVDPSWSDDGLDCDGELAGPTSGPNWMRSEEAESLDAKYVLEMMETLCWNLERQEGRELVAEEVGRVHLKELERSSIQGQGTNIASLRDMDSVTLNVPSHFENAACERTRCEGSKGPRVKL